MIHPLNPWQVQIQGNGRDLEHLARHFVTPPRTVSKDIAVAGYLYESEAFATCTTSEQVIDTAVRELAVLSGVLKLAHGSIQPLQAGGVYRRNPAGGRDAFLHIHDAVHAHFSDEVVLTVVGASGTSSIAPTPPPRAISLASLAFADEAVAKALRLSMQADATSWVSLYRLYELIEADVGGQTSVVKHGWSTTTTLRRFKHSANSVAVAGDSARHGKEPGDPPKQPMSAAEAAAYVAYFLEAWLAYKGA